MKTLSSVLLAAAVLGAAFGAEENTNGSASTAECLADFNAAREQAGLEPFTAEKNDGNKLPLSEETYIQKGASVSKAAEAIKRTGTYAYASQTGSTADCSAAVSFWKGAHKNFQELPPVYVQTEEGLYADSRNRSLVALFNPNESATVDCAYFTCPVPSTTSTTTPTTSTPTTQSQPTTVDGGQRISNAPHAEASATLESHSSEPAASPSAHPPSHEDEAHEEHHAGPSARRLATSEGTLSGLVCITNPAALVDQQRPFSEEVWANIKEAIENSASTQSVLSASALVVLASFIIF
ncbi:SAG family member [Eimeria brunetti]|uniref:SAG family member n=1 Tax=Eimeria brunetti TaxID=51314 RepID=U6LKY2_9EIME|nr:SAG family member [Eimeria brunetti]